MKNRWTIRETDNPLTIFVSWGGGGVDALKLRLPTLNKSIHLVASVCSRERTHCLWTTRYRLFCWRWYGALALQNAYIRPHAPPLYIRGLRPLSSNPLRWIEGWVSLQSSTTRSDPYLGKGLVYDKQKKIGLRLEKKAKLLSSALESYSKHYYESCEVRAFSFVTTTPWFVTTQQYCCVNEDPFFTKHLALTAKPFMILGAMLCSLFWGKVLNNLVELLRYHYTWTQLASKPSFLRCTCLCFLQGGLYDCVIALWLAW